jgi:hypothetical protein
MLDLVSPVVRLVLLDESVLQHTEDAATVSVPNEPSSPTRMVSEDAAEKANNGASSKFFPLSHHKRMASHPKHSVNKDSITFFDWDDTLLCSSYLTDHKLHLMSTDEELLPHVDALNKVANAVVHLLTTALQFSPVCIVTNAEEGWIQQSTQRFIPNVLPLLLQVQIISARSTYEQEHPNTPVVWKYAAFKDLLNATVLKGPMRQKNVLNFGDSMTERDAILAATRDHIFIKTKSLKFQHQPSIDLIIEQLITTSQYFEVIHEYVGHMDTSLDTMALL